VDEKFGLWKHSIQTLTTALEILTNLSVTTTAVELSPATIRLFLSHGVLNQLVSQLTVTHVDIEGSLARCLPALETREAIEVLGETQRTAASCLSNIVPHFPLKDLGDLNGLFTHVSTQCQQVAVQYKEGRPTAIRQVEALTGLMWAVLRKEKNNVVPSKEVLKMVCALGGQGEGATPDIRANVAGVLGCMGTIAPLFPHNFVITSVLLGMLEFEMQHTADGGWAEVVCEAVNSVIDIFSEDNMHVKVLADTKLLAKLSMLLPAFHKAVGSQLSSLDPQLVARSEETLENLQGFIEYKQQNS